MTRISTIVPAFNAEKYLERAIESLIDTGYPNLEIVIVDDGSTDSTFELASRLGAARPGIRVYRHPDGERHGVSATRNLGLVKCSGNWICFLDADDYVFPHRFDVAAARLASNPDVDGVYEFAIMEFEGGRGKERFWDDDDLFGIRGGDSGESLVRALLRGVCWQASGILFRRPLLLRTGMFSESYDYAEDYHLWLRMASVSNLVPGNTEKPVSVYFRHESNTYHGGVERKADVIRAMLDVYRWLGRRDDSLIARHVFARHVTEYVRHALVRTREEGRCDVGRNIVEMIALRGFGPALWDRELLRQSLWVLAGRTAPLGMDAGQAQRDE